MHEGDWEGMQISFDADTPAQALADGPSQIALFQHAGGERADWDDTKVQKDGNHPIVYPAAGSHATFYDDAIYIQNGSARLGRRLRQHFGAAHAQSDPRPIIVPTAAAPGSEFQWLSYLGHWGQREKGFNNGPQGPTTKKQWLRPFTWMDGIRQDSPRLPGRSDPWTGPLDGLLRGDRGRLGVHQPRGEDNARGNRPGGGPAAPDRRARRCSPAGARSTSPSFGTAGAFGQLLRGARQLYGRHWRTMLLFALTGFLILGAIQGLQYLFRQIERAARTSRSESAPAALDFKFSGSFGGFAEPIGFAIVSGTVVAFMRLLDERRAARLHALLAGDVRPALAGRRGTAARDRRCCWS